MAHLRNQATGLAATCDDALAEKFLAKGWVLASEYVNPAPTAPAGNLEINGSSSFDIEAVAEAAAVIVLARLAAKPEPVTIPAVAPADSPDGVNANPPKVEASGETPETEAPVKRGQTRRTTN